MVALIAKREWPHQWPALFSQLTQLSQHSDVHCEIVLLVLGELGEGLFSDDKMSDGRRNELLVALNAEFPALFTFCYKVLEDNFVCYKQVMWCCWWARNRQECVRVGGCGRLLSAFGSSARKSEGPGEASVSTGP